MKEDLIEKAREIISALENKADQCINTRGALVHADRMINEIAAISTAFDAEIKEEAEVVKAENVSAVDSEVNTIDNVVVEEVKVENKSKK